MNITLERYDIGPEDVIGNFYINGVLQCKTLEDQYREIKVKGDTCIPEGTYEVKLLTSGHHNYEYASGQYGKIIKEMHKGMLWLQNVPNFQGILIHIGNTDKDTEGCILVGQTVVKGVPPRRALQQSTLAYERIYSLIVKAFERKEKVTITIKKKLVA